MSAKFPRGGGAGPFLARSLLSPAKPSISGPYVWGTNLQRTGARWLSCHPLVHNSTWLLITELQLLDIGYGPKWLWTEMTTVTDINLTCTLIHDYINCIY